LFRVGESSIRFLYEYAPDKYFAIGGPTGRFNVVDGEVSPVSDEGVAFSGNVSKLVLALDAASWADRHLIAAG
jgi:hypothetical protein